MTVFARAVLALCAGALACGGDPAPVADGAPHAIFARDRSGHFLDRPFPSDELRTPEGTVDLRGFPVAGWPPARRLLEGWILQVRAQARGFSALGAVYFRFSGRLQVEERYPGEPLDPVRLYSLESLHRVPVHVRFVADGQGDPYLPSGTLVVWPDESHPLRSGELYRAVVSTAVAGPAPGWRALPGMDPDAAVATDFRVQDHVRELRSLGRQMDERIRREHLLPHEGPRRVLRLDYGPARTPEGHAATLERVLFEDGEQRLTHLGPLEGAPSRRIDLATGPYEVFELALRAPLFQPSTGRPFQSAGWWARLREDPGRADGAIGFDRLRRAVPLPESDPLRVVVQLPRDVPASATLLWFHGSGGDSYEAVERREPGLDLARLRAALAQAGVVLVSADLPPFGRRFPLLESGFDADQGQVNPANPVAMRDTVRQAAAEQRLLLRFARETLPQLFPGRVDAAHVGIFGHSTGAQVSALAGVLHAEAPDGRVALPGGGLAPPDGMLLSGAGGFLSHYPVEADVLELRARLLGREMRVTGRTLLGTLFGVPRAARVRLDRHHPLLAPFQLLVDGADPLAVAPYQPVPVRVFSGTADRQVPADSPLWLARASPRGSTLACPPREGVDGHTCAFREEAGLQAFLDFATSLGAQRDPPEPLGP